MNKNYDKIFLAYNAGFKIHITIKNDDGTLSFRNGFIKEVKPDYFVIIDDVNGLESIFFIDLNRVEPFQEARGGKLNGR